jgi:hypothetical protein
MESGNLNLLEPSGPLQACNGTALPFYLYPQNRKLGGSQSGSGRFRWKRTSSEHGTMEPPALSQYRLNYYRPSYDDEYFSHNGNRGQSDGGMTLSLILLHTADSPPASFVDSVLPLKQSCWIRADARQWNDQCYAH